MRTQQFIFLCLSTLLFLGELNANPVQQWKEDKSKTELAFSIRNMVFMRVQGKFEDYHVKLSLNKEDFTKSLLQITVNATSINTGIEDRDKHLRNEDFFEVDTFPQIIFKSTKIQHIKKNHYKLTGELTIKDKSQEISLDIDYDGLSKDKQELSFKYKGEIDRFDFGLDWTPPIPTAGLIMGNSVKIKCKLVLNPFEETFP
jgi:polyisoprenoid-binding protein YceI